MFPSGFPRLLCLGPMSGALAIKLPFGGFPKTGGGNPGKLSPHTPGCEWKKRERQSGEGEREREAHFYLILAYQWESSWSVKLNSGGLLALARQPCGGKTGTRKKREGASM